MRKRDVAALCLTAQILLCVLPWNSGWASPLDGAHFGTLASEQRAEIDTFILRQEFDKARQLASVTFGDDLSGLVSWAHLLYINGEQDRARRALEEVIQVHGRAVEVLDLLVRIETTSGRSKEAARAAAEAYEILPTPERLSALASALRTTQDMRAIAALQPAIEQQGDLPAQMALVAAMEALGRGADRLEVAKHAATAFHDDLTAKMELARALVASQPAEALKLVTDALQASRAGGSVLEAYLDILKAARPNTQTEAELARLREQFPDSADLWRLIGSRKGAAERPALFAEAARRNPDQLWPVEAGFDAAVKAADWVRVEEFIRTLDVLPAGAGGEAGAVPLARSIFELKRFRAHGTDAPRLGRALADLEAFRRAGGAEGTYHLYRFRVLQAAGRHVEARDEFLKAADILPDNEFVAVAYPFETELNYDLSDDQRLAILKRYLERDSYSADRLLNAAERQIRWRNSPIPALKILDDLKTRNPDRYAEPLAQELNLAALADLGVYDETLRLSFCNAVRLADNSSAIEDFRKLRERAQQGSSRIVDIDFRSGSVTIETPTGETYLRQDDLWSGNALRRQSGAAWIQFTYDPQTHYLLLIEASNGNTLKLTYYSTGDIATISDHSGKHVVIDYVDLGGSVGRKPSHVAVDGVGEFNVIYKPDGEIAKVDSPSGPTTSIQVATIFNNLVDMVSYAENENSDLSRLEVSSSELEGLWNRYHETADADALQAHLEAAWAVVDYVTANVPSSASNTLLVYDLLESIVERGRSAGAAAEDVAAAVKAIGAWHGLHLAGRHTKLDTEPLKRWAGMLQWLDEPAPALYAPQLVQSVRARVSQAPLTPSESTAWLQRSLLDNPGYWTRFGLGLIVPAALLGEAQIRATLVRRNGDIVAISSRGFAVLRGGVGSTWDWFVFDDGAMRFTSRADLRAGSGRGDLLSVAETDDGSLWLGTGNGVLRLSGDYEDADALIWIAPDAGLPSARITMLASLGRDVVAGTDKGPRRITAAGQVTFLGGQIDAVPVKFLRSGVVRRPSSDISFADPYPGLFTETGNRRVESENHPYLRILRGGSEILGRVDASSVVSFGLAPDVPTVALAGSGNLELWTFGDADPPRRLMAAAFPEGLAESLVGFGAGGSFFAFNSRGVLSVWSTSDGRPRPASQDETAAPFPGDPNIEMSPSREWVAVWDADTRVLRQVRFTPDGARVVARQVPTEPPFAIAYLKAVRDDGAVIFAHETENEDIAWFPESRVVERTSGEYDSTPAMPEEAGLFTVEQHTDIVLHAVDAAGTVWAVGTKVVDADSPEGHAQFGFTGSGNRLVDALGSDSILVRSVAKPAEPPLRLNFPPDRGRPAQIVVTDDEKLLFAIWSHGQRASEIVRAWSLADGKVVALPTGDDWDRAYENGDWSSMAVSNNGRRLAVMTPDRRGVIFIAAEGTVVEASAQTLLAGDGAWHHLAFPAQGPGLILVEGSDNIVRWIPETGEISDPLRREVVLVGTAAAVFGLGDGESPVRLTGAGMADAVFLQDENEPMVVFLSGTSLLAASWEGQGPVGVTRPLVVTGSVERTHVARGLRLVEVGPGETGIAILTDTGLSILSKGRFEHKELPLGDHVTSVFDLAERDGAIAVLGDDGIYQFSRREVTVDESAPVADLATDPILGVTFVARNERLDAFFYKSATADLTRFAAIKATRLAFDRDGALIANDGKQIVRFKRGNSDPEELFKVVQTVPEQYVCQGDLTQILVASDGTIWATAGASVFRWRDNKLAEFNYFLDPATFPVRSTTLANVIETVDGRIWVVASDVRGRKDDGIAIASGILEWNGSGFSPVRLPEGTPWFLTGYTRISVTEAVAGSTRGFVRQVGGELVDYAPPEQSGRKSPQRLDAADLGDLVSYKELLKGHPRLWLGTDGAQIAPGTWIFGTAGGVVARTGSTWFYPDRLNWLLPGDRAFASYGSRSVNAVAVDPDGGFYVGSDRGLLIVRNQADIADFLLTQAGDKIASQAIELARIKEQAGLLEEGVKSVPDLARRVAQVKRLETELARLRAAQAGTPLPPPLAPLASATTKPAEPQPSVDPERLRLQLLQHEREYRNLLAQIEQDNAAFGLLISAKPVDVLPLREKLRPGEVIVQVILGRKMVHVLAIPGIGGEPLARFDRPIDLDEFLANLVVLQAGLQGRNGTRLPNGPTVSDTDILGKLQYFDTLLLQPIRQIVLDRGRIYIVPNGPLAYLPWGALARTTSDHIEYAAQSFDFAVLPSLSFLRLQPGVGEISGDETLVFGGAADGSNRDEADRVSAATGGITSERLGEDASFDAFLNDAPGKRWLHLLIGGLLDGKKPERSYVTFAGGRRVPLHQLGASHLESANFAFLSNIQTTQSGDGQELGTLAWSLANSGVRSLLLPLWRGEHAASMDLMESFYRGSVNGKDPIQALGDAQREMIARDPSIARVSDWSGFIVIDMLSER
ncbi:MAG: CHAT domain-containing protein [Inquilinus sp.]|uniref:CHAT domain-containing protein n=1 Tax=Inquilinus sp. TaxID=1932117 RepID=UPI003F3DA8DA